jgi:hypothetical protein
MAVSSVARSWEDPGRVSIRPDGDAGPWKGLKGASAAHLDWSGHLGWQMQCGRVLVHRCCRLGAAVADDTIETQRGYGVLAQGAFEGCAAVHRFGCVISHVSIIVLSSGNLPGIRCAALERHGQRSLPLALVIPQARALPTRRVTPSAYSDWIACAQRPTRRGPVLLRF